MKVADKIRNKKEKVKKKSGVTKPKPKKEQVLVVAQEIKYARWLSGNDKKTRDRVLKALKKWILNCFEKRYEFKEEDFTRVWKGLFYAVWMSDKPLIQEELCENISQVLDLFPAEHIDDALLMTKAGFKMLATEWYGIDHHRLDKFLMLVRRYLRGSLRCLDRCGWSLDSCQKYADMLSGTDGLLAVKTPHYARNATSMILHITDCFLEELAKVSLGKIPESSVAALLSPFVKFTCRGSGVVTTAARRVLTALLRQSGPGIEYQERTAAWKQMGCPAGGPESLEPASDDEEDLKGDDGEGNGDTEMPLDPRAGRVDVELPLLPVPADLLANMLRDMLTQASSKAHRRVKICLERFEKLSSGVYPLPVSVPEPDPDPVPIRPGRAARSLQVLEQKLKADADELKLRGLSRKHRKRLLKKSRAGVSIVEDVPGHKKILSKESNNGEWLVEPAETKPKKTEKDTSNKENQDKSKKNSKLSAQKRKNDTELQNGEVTNKKQKLDKSYKNDLANNKNKKKDKNNLVSDKIQNKKDKNNKIKLPKSIKDVTKAETAVIPKQKDVNRKDSKTKEIKNELTKDFKEIKAKKPENQLPSQTEKSKTLKVNKSEISAKQNKIVNSKLNKGKKEQPAFLVNKTKKFQKQLPSKEKKEKTDSMRKHVYETPKKVKFELKKNSMQKPVDYYKSVRKSPNIPFDSAKKPSKTNLKPSTPSPINPFFKKKLRMKN